MNERTKRLLIAAQKGQTAVEMMNRTHDSKGRTDAQFFGSTLDDMVSRSAKVITFSNLHLANGKAVALPATTGVHLGRGFSKFDLKSLECGQLGNDAFTEVYFTTESGNVYRISQPKSGFSGHKQHWSLFNLRMKDEYQFTPAEITKGSLEAGEPFRYGFPGATSNIQAILCVNASRCYGKMNAEFVSDIRHEFAEMMP